MAHRGKALTLYVTKLDLSQAYQQMKLDEESMKYITINTHMRLYQFTRLPFGVASAPAIFQRVMDTFLHGMKGVMCLINDILVTGKTENLHTLEEVPWQLKVHRLQLKR